MSENNHKIVPSSHSGGGRAGSSGREGDVRKHNHSEKSLRSSEKYVAEDKSKKSKSTTTPPATTTSTPLLSTESTAPTAPSRKNTDSTSKTRSTSTKRKEQQHQQPEQHQKGHKQHGDDAKTAGNIPSQHHNKTDNVQSHTDSTHHVMRHHSGGDVAKVMHKKKKHVDEHTSSVAVGGSGGENEEKDMNDHDKSTIPAGKVVSHQQMGQYPSPQPSSWLSPQPQPQQQYLPPPQQYQPTLHHYQQQQVSPYYQQQQQQQLWKQQRYMEALEGEKVKLSTTTQNVFDLCMKLTAPTLMTFYNPETQTPVVWCVTPADAKEILLRGIAEVICARTGASQIMPVGLEDVERECAIVRRAQREEYAQRPSTQPHMALQPYQPQQGSASSFGSAAGSQQQQSHQQHQSYQQQPFQQHPYQQQPYSQQQPYLQQQAYPPQHYQQQPYPQQPYPQQPYQPQSQYMQPQKPEYKPGQLRKISGISFDGSEDD